MDRVVIESPYAGDVEKNVAYARKCVMDCLRRGEAPYASHLFFTQDGLLDDDNPAERALGIKAGFEWGKSADKVVVYTDLGVSRGMEKGIQFARSKAKVIEYRSFSEPATEGELTSAFLRDYPQLSPENNYPTIWGVGIGRDDAAGLFNIHVYSSDETLDRSLRVYKYKNLPHRVSYHISPAPVPIGGVV